MNPGTIKESGKVISTAWKVFLWVLRILSILLFGLLFFVGLYLKLPWKMLACIAIIPVVGIFVPRKIQPWIWGFLTVLLVAFWGWTYLPERHSDQWHPYEYADELDTIATDYFPADANNAATIYSSVLEEYGETIFYFQYRYNNDEELTLSGAWDPATFPRLDYWISTFEPGIRQLIEASRISQCRFDIPYNLATTNPQMERVYWLKEWSRLLIRSANRDLFDGNHDHAFEKFMVVPKLAQHLYQQQTLIDQAAAFNIELQGARALEMFIVDHCDDLELFLEIEDAFMDLDPQWPKNWRYILLREKLLAKNLAGLMYEVNDSGRIRISHNAMMDLQAGLGFRPRRLFMNQQQINRLAVLALWLSLPSSPQRLARIVDDRFDHYSLEVQKGTQLPSYSLKYVWVKGLNAKSVFDWLAMQKVGFFWALDGQFTRHIAIVNQIQIFTALKRYYLEYQRWPKQLDELDIEDAASVLVDPLCGKPFVYEQTEQGFRLYSLGQNGVDDGGLYNPKEKQDDIFLWPRIQTE